MSDSLARNYVNLRASLAAVCEKYGRKPEDVTLVAVSKFHPVEAIAKVAGEGQIDFGENYVQEAQQKQSALSSLPLRWHMIGHVQSKKAGQVAGNFALVHTLDSIKLADAYEKKLMEKSASQPVLFEVNIADEPQKSGVNAKELTTLGEHVLKNCPHLELKGLMCLPSVFDNGDAARPYFEKLRKLRDNLEKELGRKLPELSMGMSGDYWAAIAEGATLVRIGTTIFGPRPPKI